MSSSNFTVASTPVQQAPGRFVLHVPDGWQQGRGAFGGLVLTALVRAALASEPDGDRRLRSFNGEIAGPVLPGEALIEVTELRRGNNLSAYNATLSQEGQCLVRGSSVLARTRNAEPHRIYQAAPSPPAWADIEPVDPAAPFAPVFLRHMEMRPIDGIPHTGAKEPVATGWVRTREPLDTLGAPEIVALADAWWPASFATHTTLRPMATVAFALQCFLPDSPLDPTAPLHYRGRIVAEQDGYSMEHRELWTADGRLVAFNQQTIAWIR